MDACSKNAFKAALADPSRSRLTICWLSLASDAVAELLGQAGFSACLIDGEHAPNDVDAIRRQIMAVELGGVSSAIARTPVNEAWVIKRLMDAGAQTILVPMVDTAEAAAEAAAALRFPPEGTRGVAGASRAAGFGGYRKNYLTTANAEACCLVQIESFKAVENIEAIAEVKRDAKATLEQPYDLATAAEANPHRLGTMAGYVGGRIATVAEEQASHPAAFEELRPLLPPPPAREECRLPNREWQRIAL